MHIPHYSDIHFIFNTRISPCAIEHGRHKTNGILCLKLLSFSQIEYFSTRCTTRNFSCPSRSSGRWHLCLDVRILETQALNEPPLVGRLEKDWPFSQITVVWCYTYWVLRSLLVDLWRMHDRRVTGIAVVGSLLSTHGGPRSIHMRTNISMQGCVIPIFDSHNLSPASHMPAHARV